jgi:hypothetical protein
MQHLQVVVVGLSRYVQWYGFTLVVAHKVHKVFKVPLRGNANGTNLVDYAKVVDLSNITIKFRLQQTLSTSTTARAAVPNS